jgi:hypothetical protein
VPTGNHKRLWRTMTGIKPCWSVVRVRVNERTHAGVNGSWQEKRPFLNVGLKRGSGWHEANVPGCIRGCSIPFSGNSPKANFSLSVGRSCIACHKGVESGHGTVGGRRTFPTLHLEEGFGSAQVSCPFETAWRRWERQTCMEKSQDNTKEE